MARLPTPGSDDGTWGTILNSFLEVVHNADGTLTGGVIADAQVATGAAINPSKIAGTAEVQSNKGQANGYAGLNSSSLVPTTQLGSGTASGSNFLRGDGVWSVPSGGSSSLASDTDVAIVSPANNQVLTYSSGSSKWQNANAAVVSVFGRAGTVTAQNGDYTATQVGALPSTDDLSAIATANATAGNVSLNSHKLTNLANGTAGTDAAAFGQVVPLAGGTMTGGLAPSVFTLTFVSSGTTTIDVSKGNAFILTLADSTSTLGAPTNAVDGQTIRIRLIQDATGSRTIAYNAIYDFGAAGTPTLSTVAHKVDVLGFEYIASLTKWCYLGSVLGF